MQTSLLSMKVIPSSLEATNKYVWCSVDSGHGDGFSRAGYE